MAKRQDASTGKIVDDGKAEETKLVDEKGEPMVHIKVYSPFKTYFDEPAYSISALNDTGPFDVLPHHHNFMTLINPCDMVVKTKRGDVKIRIARGVMHIKAEKITVFLDV